VPSQVRRSLVVIGKAGIGVEVSNLPVCEHLRVHTDEDRGLATLMLSSGSHVSVICGSATAS